jgi:hypothetical protein
MSFVGVAVIEIQAVSVSLSVSLSVYSYYLNPSFLFAVYDTVGPGPHHDDCNCVVGKLGDACRHGKGVSKSSECSSSNNSSTNSDGSTTTTTTTTSDGTTTTSSASSAEYGGYGGDGDGSSNSASSNNANDKAIPEGAAMINPNDFSFWMIVAAAVAAAFATGAVVMGQRKKHKDPHPLSGSVARRMGLFSNFADSALCNQGTERPARVVEMTMSKEDYSMA